ncbi:Swarming motility protein ybiA [Pelomyxa schiedti]|nr:Swarming motility protein ybiA [Pelomyxa schiedti]
MATIYFSEPEGQYACFSNFYEVDFVLDGKSWTSTEAYFQAHKFTTPEYQEQIRRSDPGTAKTLGSQRRPDYRKDWDDVRNEYMKGGIRAKFQQHPDLAAILLSTGDSPIAERAPYDAYWGDGPDGKGKNMLGKILQELRTELRG